MDKFTEKSLKKSLTDLGVIKIFCKEENKLVPGCAFEILFDYKIGIFCVFSYIMVTYKDITPGYFLEKIEEEIAKKRKKIDTFIKRERLYRKYNKYSSDEIGKFIINEVGQINEILKKDIGKKEIKKYNFTYIEEQLKEGSSPMEILTKLKEIYGENITKEDIIERDMCEIIKQKK